MGMILIAKSRMMRRTRGFTAIEITAVATIIAILSMLVLPLLRGRVKEARIVAAQDDLSQLAKAEMLVYADTDFYFRLQDLDNTKRYVALANWTPDLDVPHCYWNEEISPMIRDKLAEKWHGSYISIPRSSTVSELVTSMPNLFWGDAGAGGPIFITTRDDLAEDRYPIDPWGNPYIFFGDKLLYDQATSNQDYPVSVPPVRSETVFSNAVIYCMGPDGFPGDASSYAAAPGPESYLREGGLLGAKPTDDMEYIF